MKEPQLGEIYSLPAYVGQRDPQQEEDRERKLALARQWLAERGITQYLEQPSSGREETK
jgi:hypothetical protein